MSLFWKRNVQLWPEILGGLSQGSDTGPTADLDLESDDEGGDEGEEEVGVDDQDEVEETAAAGASIGSGPDSEADSAESWLSTLNYLIKLSYIIYKILPTGLLQQCLA